MRSASDLPPPKQVTGFQIFFLTLTLRDDSMELSRFFVFGEMVKGGGKVKKNFQLNDNNFDTVFHLSYR